MRVDDYCQAVIEGGKLTLAQQGVLWMVARFVNHDTGATWVSLATIADRCGRKDRRQISEHVHALADAGVFRLSPRINGRSQLIEFPLHPTLTGYPPTGAENPTGSYPQPVGKPVPVGDDKPVQVSAPTSTGFRENQSGNPRTNSYEPVSNPRAAAVDDAIPDWFAAKLKDRRPSGYGELRDAL